MNTLSQPVTITEQNIDSLPRLDHVPAGCALMDMLPDREKIGGSHLRWALTLEDGRRLRSRYRNDLIHRPLGGEKTMFITERAAREWGSYSSGEIITCAGLVADPQVDIEDWRGAQVVG